MKKYLPFAVFVAAALLVSYCDITPKDDTDGKERSGFILYTDYGTGCQYLSTVFALSPRLGKDGKQICLDVAK